MHYDDIDDLPERLSYKNVPNLLAGAKTLKRLMRWTNSHSDGWAYWAKPRNAARRLEERLDALHTNVHGVVLGEVEDITTAELRYLLAPIKGFLTRQGVDHEEVIWLPERDNRQRSVARIMVNVYLPVDVRRLSDEEQERYRIALFSLADIMGVQAEDGLYLFGSPDTEGGEIDGVEVKNEHVSDIVRFETATSLGTYEVPA